MVSRAERREKLDTSENAQHFSAVNPLLEGLTIGRRPEPCAMVIFGASGDLTKRKLFPALYSLAYRGLLPEKFGVVGVARTDLGDDEFRERMKAAVQEFGRDEFREDVWQWLADGMHYASSEFTEMKDADPVVDALGGRRAAEGWTRLIVEKPFGHDLGSARELNELVHRYFEESEIFR